VCGNCHSFSAKGKVLGIDVDYGNDKGAYAIIPVEKEMVMNDSTSSPGRTTSGTTGNSPSGCRRKSRPTAGT